MVMDDSEADRIMPKRGMFAFKYIGEVPNKYLEDLFMELDAVKPWYVEDEQLNKIMIKNKDKIAFKVYYCEDNNEFMLEPVGGKE
jgi:hypothetical protein